MKEGVNFFMCTQRPTRRQQVRSLIRGAAAPLAIL